MKTKIILYRPVIPVLLLFFITCCEESPPELRVNASSFNFTSSTNINTLIISNSGDGELSWEITGKPDWLETSKSSGIVTTGVDTVIVTADINQAAGTYSGTININSNGGNKDVTISLTISVWTERAPMLTNRFALCAVEVDGKIYAIGGLQTMTIAVSNVEEYDPITNRWIEKTPMPAARGAMGCGVVDGKIYVIGGANPDVIATVEVYDPATDSWTTKTPMPTPRSYISASVVNGKIYAFGGTDQKQTYWYGLNTVEEYDPTTDSWTTKDSMPTIRYGLSTSVVNEKIYAIGGFQFPDIPYAVPYVEVYDPAIDTWTAWTENKSMRIPRCSLSCSAVDGKIYAIGGWRNGAHGPLYNSVEKYDPETDTWTGKTGMPSEIAELITCFVNGKIYAIGGTITHYPFTSGINTVYAYDPVADPTTIHYVF